MEGSSAPSPSGQSFKRSPKYPDPPMFTGEKDTLDHWCQQLAAKLRTNGDWYPTEEDRLLYTFSRLAKEGGGQNLGYRILKGGAAQISTVDQLLAELEITFGDPDKKKTARRQLSKLRQANKSLALYLADFQRYRGAAAFPPEEELDKFREGLSDEQHENLAHNHQHVVNMDLSQLVHFCQSYETVRQGYAEDKKMRANQNYVKGKSSTSTTTTPATNTSTNDTNTAMDLSKVTTKSGKRAPLTPEEKARRFMHNLCMYCGEAGHMALECPHKKPSTVKVAELGAPVAPAVPHVHTPACNHGTPPAEKE